MRSGCSRTFSCRMHAVYLFIGDRETDLLSSSDHSLNPSYSLHSLLCYFYYSCTLIAHSHSRSSRQCTTLSLWAIFSLPPSLGPTSFPSPIHVHFLSKRFFHLVPPIFSPFLVKTPPTLFFHNQFCMNAIYTFLDTSWDLIVSFFNFSSTIELCHKAVAINSHPIKVLRGATCSMGGCPAKSTSTVREIKIGPRSWSLQAYASPPVRGSSFATH